MVTKIATISITIIFFLCIVAEVQSQDITIQTSAANTTFCYEEHTKGTGFFTTYERIIAHTETIEQGMNQRERLGTLETKEVAHGSGIIETEDLTIAKEESIYKYNLSTSRYESWTSAICKKSDTMMEYAPTTFSIGTRYYEKQPIEFEAQLTKDSCVKNYHTGDMAHREVRYADWVDAKEELFAKGTVRSPDPSEDIAFSSPYVDTATNMKLEDNVIGDISIQALRTDTIPLALEAPEWIPFTGDDLYNHKGVHVIKEHNIDIDEHYSGAYQLERNITFETHSSMYGMGEGLSCCFAGHDDLPFGYRLGLGNLSCFK